MRSAVLVLFLYSFAMQCALHVLCCHTFLLNDGWHTLSCRVLWVSALTTAQGFSFYGSHLRHAVVEDAANPALFPYPNLANATNVLVSGTSAPG